MKPFDFKEKRLTNGKPEKECLTGNYKKQKSYETIKNEIYSSNPENIRTKAVALSASFVLNSKFPGEKSGWHCCSANELATFESSRH